MEPDDERARCGEIDLLIRDYDGTQRESFTEAWVLEREMSIDVGNFATPRVACSKTSLKTPCSWEATVST